MQFPSHYVQLQSEDMKQHSSQRFGYLFIFSQLNLFLQLHLKTVPAIKVRDINLINKTWIACIHPKSYFRMQSSFLTQLLSVQSRLLLNKHFKLIRHQLCGKMDTHLVCSNCLIPPPPTCFTCVLVIWVMWLPPISCCTYIGEATHLLIAIFWSSDENPVVFILPCTFSYVCCAWFAFLFLKFPLSPFCMSSRYIFILSTLHNIEQPHLFFFLFHAIEIKKKWMVWTANYIFVICHALWNSLAHTCIS